MALCFERIFIFSYEKIKLIFKIAVFLQKKSNENHCFTFWDCRGFDG